MVTCLSGGDIKVYELLPDKLYPWFGRKGCEDGGYVNFMPDQLYFDQWVPLEVELYFPYWDYLDWDPGQVFSYPGDYVHLMSPPAFSERAITALADLLFNHGELLPLLSEFGSYYAFNTTRLVEIDSARSEVSVLWREKPAFDTRNLSEVNIFKPFARKEDGSIFISVGQTPYVTDPFVQRVEETGLTGFDFNLIWSDQEENS